MAITKYEWDTIRSMWEGGQDASVIAGMSHMPTKQRINQVCKQQGWQRREVEIVSQGISMPTDLTKEKQLYVLALNNGANYKLASALSGRAERTTQQWREDPDFSALCDLARGGKSSEYLDCVTQAAKTDPKWAAWLLERHDLTRDSFGRSEGHRFQGNTFNVLGHIDTGITRSD